jgi:hypothetical protein
VNYREPDEKRMPLKLCYFTSVMLAKEKKRIIDKDLSDKISL